MGTQLNALDWARLGASARSGESDFWQLNAMTSEARTAMVEGADGIDQAELRGLEAIAGNQSLLESRYSLAEMTVSQHGTGGRYGFQNFYRLKESTEVQESELLGGNSAPPPALPSEPWTWVGPWLWLNPWIWPFFFAPPPPPPPPSKHKCCPVSIDITVQPISKEKGLDELIEQGGMKWKVDVEAEWKEDDSGCECKCCVVKQYVATSHAHDDMTLQAAKLSAGELDRVKEAAKGTEKLSENPRWGWDFDGITASTTGGDLWKGFKEYRNTFAVNSFGHVYNQRKQLSFVEDVTFNLPVLDSGGRPELDSFGKQIKKLYKPWTLPRVLKKKDFGSDSRGGKVKRVMNHHNVPTVVGGKCKYSYTDLPSCQAAFREDVRFVCNTFLVVVIMPRAGCTGDTEEADVDLSYAVAMDKQGTKSTGNVQSPATRTRHRGRLSRDFDVHSGKRR